MDPEKKSLNFIFPTKCVIPKSLKFSHWPSKYIIFTDPWFNKPPPTTSCFLELAADVFFALHIVSSWGAKSFDKELLNYIWDITILVGGFNPSEKY